MQTQTLTEQTLCRIWREADRSGEWIDCAAILKRIAAVLVDCACNDDAVRMFMEAADLAMARATARIAMKEAA